MYILIYIIQLIVLLYTVPSVHFIYFISLLLQTHATFEEQQLAHYLLLPQSSFHRQDTPREHQHPPQVRPVLQVRWHRQTRRLVVRLSCTMAAHLVCAIPPPQASLDT